MYDPVKGCWFQKEYFFLNRFPFAHKAHPHFFKYSLFKQQKEHNPQMLYEADRSETTKGGDHKLTPRKY